MKTFKINTEQFDRLSVCRERSVYSLGGRGGELGEVGDGRGRGAVKVIPLKNKLK